ncbi:MAG TPA: MauE/DoxX family redox-associated membrane protein [Sphingobium sp.]
MVAAAQIAASLGYAVHVMVAIILVSAGAAKLRNWPRFRATVMDYRILPERTAAFAAAALPPLEMLLGISLLLQMGSIPGLATAALLLTFAAAIAINLYRGRTAIDCGCSFAHEGQPIRSAMVVRNLVIAAALLAATAAPSPGSAVFSAMAACVGTMLFLFYVIFNQIIALSGRFPARR